MPGFSKAREFIVRHFFCLLTILALFAYGTTYLESCFGPPIRSDGIGYYAYLPSYIVHGDPTFEKAAVAQYGGAFPDWCGVMRHPVTGRYLDMYGVGVSLMIAPAFLAAHVLTLLMRSPVAWHHFNYAPDGYSFFYQHAAGLSGLFYMIAGLFILSRALGRRFSPGVVAATLAALTFGTNLFHYGTGESVVSHPYSFFLFSALIHVTGRIYEPSSGTRWWVLLGVVAGGIALVRLPNVVILPLIPLYGVARAGDVRPRGEFLWRHRARIALALVTAAAVFFLQMAVWRISTGHWYVNSYQALYPDLQLMDWSHPKVLETLFSIRRGILFWSPILILGVAGLLTLRRRAPEMWLPVLVCMPPVVMLVATWHDWTFGGGFSHRGFVESYALMAFPMASLYATVAASSRRAIRWAVGLLSLLLVLHSLFFMMLYYTREISYYGLDAQALFDIFWWRKEVLLEQLRGLL